jgi:hypothetical protein
VSRGRAPYTAKVVAAPAPDPTCSGCRHWRHQGRADIPGAAGAAELGVCVACPPAIVKGPTVYGPLCLYPVTTADTFACGRHEPRTSP